MEALQSNRPGRPAASLAGPPGGQQGGLAQAWCKAGGLQGLREAGVECTHHLGSPTCSLPPDTCSWCTNVNQEGVQQSPTGFNPPCWPAQVLHLGPGTSAPAWLPTSLGWAGPSLHTRPSPPRHVRPPARPSPSPLHPSPPIP